MANFITGSSNYPFNFDLFPTGVGTNPTIAYVLDEIRDTNGVVIQSGTPITAVELNTTYTIIDKFEHVLGYNPEGSFTDVASRLNNMQFSGSNSFLHLSGGSVFGPVDFISGSSLNVTTLNGNSLKMTLSGTTNIFGSGNINLSSTGNLAITVANATITGIAVKVQGTNLNLNGGATTVISAGPNITTMISTGTYVNQSIIPITGSTVNLGSIGSSINNLYVNNIITTGLGSVVSGYVATSGSSMSGNLSMTGTSSIVLNTGTSITFIGSGINNIGSSNNPASGIYTKTLYATFVSGLSPVTFQSNIVLNQGLTVSVSGTGVVVGSALNPIDTIYVSHIVGATGLDATQLVQRSGSSMFGNLTISGNANLVLNSGSNISIGTSGQSNIGSTGSYVGNVYTNSINNRPLGNMVFNELLTGVTNGVNRTFFFSHTPASNYAMVFVSGLYVRPSVDYVFSGNAVVFTGSFAAPTTSPYAGFYVY